MALLNNINENEDAHHKKETKHITFCVIFRAKPGCKKGSDLFCTIHILCHENKKWDDLRSPLYFVLP
jgi:hypothetical protein